MDILLTIKRLAFRRDLIFTVKAEEEMELDDITKDEVVEAIVNAHRIDKVLHSRSRFRESSKERLYVIKGMTFDNVVLYTKGKIKREMDREVFYVLVSCKRAL